MPLMTTMPLWITGEEHDAATLRQVASMFASGVVGVTDLAVSQRGLGANMSVDVAPGLVVLPGPAGKYIARLDEIVNLTITAAPAPGNQRIDSIYAAPADPEIQPGDAGWIIEKVTGTASASPAAPTLPAYAVELARVTLTSSTTSITSGAIANRRPSASPIGYIGPTGQTPLSPVAGQIHTNPAGEMRLNGPDGWKFVPTTAWPMVQRATPTGLASVSTLTEWGRVTFDDPVGPAVQPDRTRSVLVVATFSGNMSSSDGSASSGSFWIRLQRVGESAIDAVPILVSSPNNLTFTPISHTFAATLSGGAGELYASVRVDKQGGSNCTFSNCTIVATAYPR